MTEFIRRCPPEQLILGAGSQIDPTAIIGETPERSISDLSLRIGARARIRSGTIVYSGTRIGADLNTGHHVIIREENTIGDSVSIWSHSNIDYGCRIGDRVKIHSGVYIPQFTVIEDDVFIAPGVIMGNDLHPGCEKSRDCLKGPVVKRGAQIGLNVTILPYVTIGAGALIGAGSVVTRNIPPRAVAFGNPARVIKNVDEIGCIHTPPWVENPYRDKG